MNQTTMPALRRRNERRPVPGSAVFNRENPFIYMGTVAGARKHRARPGALIVPLDVDPELFRWPVDGLQSVLLVCDEESERDAAKVAGCILRDGADSVVVVGCGGPARLHRQSFTGASPGGCDSLT